MRQRILFILLAGVFFLAAEPILLAQFGPRNFEQENRRLREERDSLRVLLEEYQDAYSSPWDDLLDVDWEGEYEDLFGSSAVLRESDGAHSSFMKLIRKAAPSVASRWDKSIEDQVSVYIGPRKRYLPAILGRYEYYLPFFSKVFAKYGVPEELISLCIVESAVTSKAVSHAGAAGMWQLMPATARMYGLQVDEEVDERFDVVKSTDAAARLLRDLHKGLGRWDLAVLSYNCGSGRVRQAILKANGDPDVWKIAEYLPKETRRYLPSFLAARYVLSEREALGIDIKRIK